MKSLITTQIIIPKNKIITNDYIENTLKAAGYDFVRWAITRVDNSEITVSVSHIKKLA